MPASTPLLSCHRGSGTEASTALLVPCSYHLVIITTFPSFPHTSQVFKIIQDRIRDWLLLFYFFSSLKEKGVEMFLKVPLSSSSLTVTAGRCMATCAEGEQTAERCDLSPESASSHFFRPYV